MTPRGFLPGSTSRRSGRCCTRAAFPIPTSQRGTSRSPARSRARSASSWDEFNALPRTEITEDIHCVTRWSRFDVTFEGVHWSELEKLVTPKPSAHFVVAHSEQGYTANVPIASLRDPLAAARHARGRRTAHARARLAATPRDPGQVLLEERQVAPRNRAHGQRSTGLLGALRVPQRRGSVRGRAIRVLAIRPNHSTSSP